MVSKKGLRTVKLFRFLIIFSSIAISGIAAGQEATVPTMLSMLLSSEQEYKEVTTGTGRIWLDRNLGANRVASSSTDADAYGDYYQWGRLTDGHQYRASPVHAPPELSAEDSPGHGDFITTNLSPNDWRAPQNDSLWQGVSGINNPCPAGFRLPTDAEFSAERVTWSSADSEGAFASPLKLVLGGARSNRDGTLSIVGTTGFYWSSTVSGSKAFILKFDDSEADVNDIFGFRAAGFSVRCIKD